MAIEVNKMLRFVGKPQSNNDRVKRQHNLCHAEITMYDGAQIEAFGKFYNDEGDFICYLLQGHTAIGGQPIFYIKTDTDFAHSVDARGEYIVVECRGVYLQHEDITDFKYKVLDYNSAEEAVELICKHSQTMGNIIVRNEEYYINTSRKWFEDFVTKIDVL